MDLPRLDPVPLPVPGSNVFEFNDQGVTRFWRFQFTFAGFGMAGNNAFNTEAALATGNQMRMIGVDAAGNAVSTLTFTLP